ncbi:MAG TPA: hypothetical protein PK217_00525 [Sphingopyxis terrae]|nr:hypothetical protein [Sphingopyxis terrae]
MDRLQIANLVMMLLFGAAALRWGAAPERICVAILGFVTLADPVYHLLAGHGAIYGSVDLGHLTFDLMMAAGFIAVALWANRIYPLWLAGFQLVSVIGHFSRELTSSFPKLAYGLMIYGPFYIILPILGFGIWRHGGGGATGRIRPGGAPRPLRRRARVHGRPAADHAFRGSGPRPRCFAATAVRRS